MITRSPQIPSTIRCAVYTRVSTTEGLSQDFNSLQSQREYCELFIKSQAALGWICLPTLYDDAGFSGGTLNRPAFKRLKADVQAGKIDCIVVYKYERLSRSLRDFLEMMEWLGLLRVTFVSVTQQFNTSTSAGRMSLNIMLSLAQYERENASERTRDKIAASRRKGKWSGGHPILGYDVDPRMFKLVVNPEEAERVREIFNLYLERQALLLVVQELTVRGWCSKKWTTRKGAQRGGRPIDKCALHQLLTNDAYVGLVKHKENRYPGEHEAIIDTVTFQRVQDLLRRNGISGGAAVRNRYGALLKGLLRCRTCDCAMSHSYTSKGPRRKYRYYVCNNAQKHGWKNCPSPSVPAQELENMVLDQIRSIGNDPRIVSATLIEAQKQSRELIQALASEQRALQRDARYCETEIHKLAGDSTNAAATARLADLNERLTITQRRLTEVEQQTCDLERELISEDEVAAALKDLGPVWDGLSPRERVRIVELLVKQVSYDGQRGTLSITFHDTGFSSLAKQQTQHRKELA